MKKVSFVALALIAMLSVASCKSDKCKCTTVTTVGDKVTTTEAVGNRPDDKKCSDLNSENKVDALKTSVVITCKNHHE